MTRELSPDLLLAARQAAEGLPEIEWPDVPTTDPKDFKRGLMTEGEQTGRILTGQAVANASEEGGSGMLVVHRVVAEGFAAGLLVGLEAADRYGPEWVAWVREHGPFPLINQGVARASARRIAGGHRATRAAARDAGVEDES